MVMRASSRASRRALRSRVDRLAALVALLALLLVPLSAAPARAGVTVRTVTFASAGVTLVGHHYVGANPAPRHPVVVMGHGFGGVQSLALPAFAQRFAAAGYDVLTFDYRTWGESGGSPRQIIDLKGQLADWHAAIAFARTLPTVDPARVALWGTSMSGGHVLKLAVTEPGVRAVIAQAPHVNGPKTVLALQWRTLPALAAKGLQDRTRAALGLSPVYVPIVGAPGTLATLTQPDAVPGYASLQPPPSWQNAVAARIALELPPYSPDDDAARSRVPTFIEVQTSDDITPAAPARALALAMRATLKEHPGGHFDVYPGHPAHAAVLAEEVAFLKRVLPA